MTSTSSIGGIATQVQQIESRLEQLSSGALLDNALGIDSDSSSTATSSSSSTGSFADALASIEGDANDVDTTGMSTGTDSAESANSVVHTPTSTANVTLPSTAGTLLSTDQQTFAKELSAKTGLSPSVVCAWLLAEESGSAASSRQSSDNNDWLNIGYTDSSTYGSSDSIWSNPTSAADATADWLKGKDSIPGYGTASSGIQSILNTVGQSTTAQISALQNSGWASSGYPDLNQLYSEVTGA